MPGKQQRPTPSASALGGEEQAELASMELSNSEVATVLDAMGMGAEGQKTDAAAAEGFGGESLPYQAELEAGFGTDLSGLSASVGGSAGADLDAKGMGAAIQGNDIGFADQPNLWMAAHEVAHSLLGHTGGDHGEEHEADKAADTVASGGQADLGSVQGTEKLAAFSTDGRFKIGAGHETATDSRQTLYASDARLQEANAKLASAGKDGSFISLEKGAGEAELAGNTVYEIKPVWVPKGDKDGMHGKVSSVNKGEQDDSMGRGDGSMALWSDCGRSSAAVTGSQSWGDRSVHYNKDGKERTSKGASDSSVSGWLRTEPGGFANAVYMDVLPSFVRKPANKKFLTEGTHYTTKRYTGFAKFIRSLLGRPTEEVKFISPKDVQHSKVLYAALTEEGQDAFDKETGINHYANPEIGQTYSMATEGDMPGFEEVKDEDGEAFTWNYHWAGVVMKDQTDNISLENYAVTREYAEEMGVKQGEFVNREWNFDMYGTEDKEQSFHHAHLATGTHGTKATSIVAGVDK